MSGRRSQRKGSNFERTIANKLSGNRVPLSGAVVGFPGDVVADIAGERWRIECKKRGKDAFKFDYNNLANNDALIKAADYKKSLITLELDKFLELIARIPADDTPDTPSDWGRTGN